MYENIDNVIFRFVIKNEKYIKIIRNVVSDNMTYKNELLKGVILFTRNLLNSFRRLNS